MSEKVRSTLTPSSVIVVVGPPNAGKGTHVALLGERLKAVHFSVGDLLRAEAKSHILVHMNSGALAPSDHVRSLLQAAIEDVPLDQMIVFDGAKKLAEAKWLLDFLPSIGRRLDHVISLVITEEESRQRSALRSSLHGRPDDADHVQAVRWEKYYEEVLPALDLYRSRDLLIEVSAMGSKDEVAGRVREALGI